MSEQNVPTTVSLLERGRYFLQDEQFKAADLYFNRVLDADPHNHEAFWGLLLCDYQCRNTAELYTVSAIPFDSNTHYQHAIEHADETAATQYRAVLAATLLACHARILEQYEAGNAFLLKEWISLYQNSAAKDPTFAALHNLTDKNGHPVRLSDPTTAATMLAFDRLYDGIRALPADTSALIDKLRATVKRLYTAAMTQMLDDLSARHPAASDALDRWAHPAAAHLPPMDDLAGARINLDGNGQTAAARYTTLAAALEKMAHKTAEDCAAILYCYKQAEATATSDDERRAVEAAKLAYSDRAVAATDTTDEVILYFIEQFPHNGDYCRRYVAYRTVDYSKKLTTYPTDKEQSSFLNKKRDDYTADAAAGLAQKQLTRIADVEQEYAAHLADVTPYANKALTLLAEPQAFKTEWESYCDRLRKEHEQTISTLRERHGQIVQKQRTDNKAGGFGATVKGIVATIGSYLAVCLSVPVLLCGLYTLKHSTELLRYPLIPAVLIALGVCLVLHFIKRPITKKLKKYRPKKYMLPKVCTLLLKLAPTVSLLFSLACAALFVYSFVTFPERVGIVPITTAEELVYIKNAPHADFVLTADIDLQGETLPKVTIRTGDIDGDGHTIVNAVVDSNMIRFNYGTISDLTLRSVTLSGDGTSPIGINAGTLRNITISSPAFEDPDGSYYGFVDKNKGRMESCTLDNVSGECGSLRCIAYSNEGDILACSVKNVNIKAKYTFIGIAGSNKGTIAGCSFTGNVTANSIYGIAGSLKRDEAVISQCSTSGNFTAKVDAVGLIGDIGDACIVENCYSVAKLTLMPINDAGTSVVGLIGSISSIDEEKCATVRNSYFGGSITAKPGDMYRRYGYAGAMIGNTYPFSDRQNYQQAYYIDFDGCFAVTSYSLKVDRAYQSDDYLSIKTENSYFTSKYDIPDSLETYNDTNITTKNKILNKKFLTETLGWDTEIWNIQNGKLPTLKPYVIPVEETATDESSTSEEGSK